MPKCCNQVLPADVYMITNFLYDYNLKSKLTNRDLFMLKEFNYAWRKTYSLLLQNAYFQPASSSQVSLFFTGVVHPYRQRNFQLGSGSSGCYPCCLFEPLPFLFFLLLFKPGWSPRLYSFFSSPVNPGRHWRHAACPLITTGNKSWSCSLFNFSAGRSTSDIFYKHD